MDSRRIKIIALILAIGLTIIFYIFISRSPNNKEDSGLIESLVIVATEDIPPYTEITGEMISQEKIGLEKSMENIVTNKEDVIGKISNSHIFGGEILFSNRLASHEDSSLGLSVQIGEGMRAITVAVDMEQGVSDTIRVGNYVDIIYIGETTEENSAAEYFDSIVGETRPLNTQTLYPGLGNCFSVIALQNIKVISLDDIFYKREGNTQVVYNSVTLEVTPEEATKIALLPEEGDIRLVLRPMEDNNIRSYPRDTIMKDIDMDH